MFENNLKHIFNKKKQLLINENNTNLKRFKTVDIFIIHISAA